MPSTISRRLFLRTGVGATLALTLSAPQETETEPQIDDALINSWIDTPGGGLVLATGGRATPATYVILGRLDASRRSFGRPVSECGLHTVEDPIRRRLPGFEQSEVDPRHPDERERTIAGKTRLALRYQDPGVLFVSEIRNFETAQLVITAGLTGHLVFSTVPHGGASRLIQLGVERYLVEASLLYLIET